MSRTRTFAITLIGAALISGAALAQQSGGRGGGDAGGAGGGTDPGNAVSVLINATTVPGGPNRPPRARSRGADRHDCSEHRLAQGSSGGGWQARVCHVD